MLAYHDQEHRHNLWTSLHKPDPARYVAMLLPVFDPYKSFINFVKQKPRPVEQQPILILKGLLAVAPPGTQV